MIEITLEKKIEKSFNGKNSNPNE